MLAEHLDKRILEGTPDSVPNRNGYGEGLAEAGKRDKRIVALCGDLTESTRTHMFKELFPERFVQVGICEQNMASVASGMAAMGKIPFIASYAMFSPGRSWEQVRTTIAYNNSNVKIIGAHAGISVGPDGATHQAIEDMAIMSVIPNMIVIAPADVHEARKATLEAAKLSKPIYIRITREKTDVVTTEQSPFEIGQAYPAYTIEGATVGFVSTGTLLGNAIRAADRLTKAGKATSVLHCPTIKPIDEEAVTKFAADKQLLVTIEEHQTHGGLGGIVSEFISSTNPKKILRIGVNDQFGQSGTPDELLTQYGLDVDGIVRSVTNTLS